jgi:hypothetical protein
MALPSRDHSNQLRSLAEDGVGFGHRVRGILGLGVKSTGEARKIREACVSAFRDPERVAWTARRPRGGCTQIAKPQDLSENSKESWD